MRTIRKKNRPKRKHIVVMLDYNASCAGKKVHRNRADAEIARGKTKNGHKMLAYKCRHCGFWHIGKA